MKKCNEIIRELREDHDLTQPQVAKLLGTSQQYYSKYETGARELPLRHVLKLADYYNVPVEYLLGRSRVKHRAGSDLLGQTFVDTVTVGELVSKAMQLDQNGRRGLMEFLGFLASKNGRGR